MTFLWHHALWLLLVLPMLAGGYLAWIRRTNKRAVRYASVALLRAAMTPATRLRPHLPPLVFFIGLVSLVFATARPAVLIRVVSGDATAVLLMDVSLSMAASDVPPTRLDAARAAAKRFISALPHHVRIAVVAFGAYADVVQAPTTARKDVIAALDRLELQRYTAIGNGLMGALLTIDPRADIPQGYDIFGSGRAPEAPSDDAPPQRIDTSAAIILVSDGKGTMGVPAVDAAKRLARLGIRVYTVGVGTLYGGVAHVEGYPAVHAEFEEDTLKEIASITGGDYFLARDAAKLAKIYERLGRREIFETGMRELTPICAALGALLIVAAAGLSLVSRRLSANA